MSLALNEQHKSPPLSVGEAFLVKSLIYVITNV